MIDTGPDWVEHPCSLKELATTAHQYYAVDHAGDHLDYDPNELTATLAERHNCYLTAASFPHVNYYAAGAIVFLWLIAWVVVAVLAWRLFNREHDDDHSARP